jgi:hypothetical protein
MEEFHETIQRKLLSPEFSEVPAAAAAAVRAETKVFFPRVAIYVSSSSYYILSAYYYMLQAVRK